VEELQGGFVGTVELRKIPATDNYLPVTIAMNARFKITVECQSNASIL